MSNKPLSPSEFAKGEHAATYTWYTATPAEGRTIVNQLKSVASRKQHIKCINTQQKRIPATDRPASDFDTIKDIPFTCTVTATLRLN